MDVVKYLSANWTRSARRYQAAVGNGGRGVGEGNQCESVDKEWVEIDEPVGLFLPRMKRRRHLLQLDQVHHTLHYDNYRRFVRVHDIALVTAVEEVDDDGQFQWWMSIQDSSFVQVWIIHFASLQQLQSWVNLLRTVTAATQTPALIGDIVVSSPAQALCVSCSPDAKETILEMAPEQD